MTFDGAVIVRSRWSGLVALTSLAVLLGSAVAMAFGSGVAIVGLYAAYPLVIGAALHLGWVGAKPRPERIEVSGKSVRAGGRLLRSRLASARIIPRAPHIGPLVELRRRLDPHPARVAVATDDDARALLRALGLDPREGTTRFRLPLASWTWVLLVVFWWLCSIIAGLVSPFAFCALVPLVIVSVRLPRRTVTIGQDGILIEGFPRRRFIPYASIANVTREARFNRQGPMVSRGFWVELRSGERTFLSTLNERLREGMLEGDHLFQAAKDAHERAQQAQGSTTDMLVRGGRPTREWLGQLKTLREARYRVASMPDEALLSLLNDPNADTSARAAAAICLSGAGEEGRARVRIAVEGIASPELRAATLAALGDDEEALAESLEAL